MWPLHAHQKIVQLYRFNMSEAIEFLDIWSLALGREYGVNPIIFGFIYVGTIPFFLVSMAWLYKNYQKKKSVILPSFCATGCFISSYLYLMVAGKNVPWWVFAAVIAMVAYGGYSTAMKARKKISVLEKKEKNNASIGREK